MGWCHTAEFKYVAADSGGKRIKGRIKADSRLEAVAKIRERGELPEKVTEISGNPLLSALVRPSAINDGVLAIVASRFSALLKAGIPLGRAVELVAEQTSDRAAKKLLKACAADVKSGVTLADSLNENGKGIIPRTFSETVRVGEESGTLEACFRRLENQFANSNKIRKKLTSALIYPAFLAILAAVVVWIVASQLLPSVFAVYENIGEDIPKITRALVSASEFISHSLPFALPIAVLLVIVIRAALGTPSGRLFASKLVLKLPIIGKISLYNASARFADTFSVLVLSGLTAVKALEISAEAVGNAALSRSLGGAVSELEAGKPLSAILRANPYLPELIAETAAVGEESGLLGETLASVGEYYYGEAYSSAERALILLEPALTLIMGAVAAFIIIAIYVPMFGMYNGLA